MSETLQVPIQYIETMLPACYGGRDLTTSDRFQPGFQKCVTLAQYRGDSFFTDPPTIWLPRSKARHPDSAELSVPRRAGRIHPRRWRTDRAAGTRTARS